MAVNGSAASLGLIEWASGCVQAAFLALLGWLHVRQGRLEAALAEHKTDQQRVSSDGDDKLWGELRELRRIMDARHEMIGRDLREMVTKQDLRDFELRLARRLDGRVVGE